MAINTWHVGITLTWYAQIYGFPLVRLQWNFNVEIDYAITFIAPSNHTVYRTDVENIYKYTCLPPV